ncbi:glycan biosynthesis hexose transferase WsfD [Carnobacterium divergens]|uniref:glycan biosynthesis hexose transferase WsfD n=1 Tax=Carnobacterium divergens TaxID=2748 RepID=UPI001D0471E7|nr:hypothetical protein [Carnobacterium divergens]MDT1940221.1 hypothetical protein [Carnobacterium divergens]MDT1942659.1 hypothetical protein [Carnobacterium divergens]MDT1948465.1 hypothetical protein [Carnobacterium divergens]
MKKGLRAMNNGYTKTVNFLDRFISPALFSVCLVAIIVGIVLFVPPYNGIADNGDFFRMIYSNGLYHLPGYSDHYFVDVVKKLGIMQYYNENLATIFSSQPLFIKLAIFVNKLFYSNTVFDLRFMGLIYYVFYLGGIYLLVEGLTYRVASNKAYLIGLITVFIFGDTAYTVYFNSLYSEPIMFIAMLYIISGTLLLYRQRYNDTAMVALVTVSSIILVTVKQQNAPLAICLAFLYIAFWFVRKERFYRIGVSVGLVLVLISGVATYKLITSEFEKINQYQSLTRGVLLESKEPEAALADGGMSEQYALLKGNTFFQKYKAIDVNSPYLFKHFYNEYGFGWILKHYLFHPDELFTLLDIAARDIHEVQPREMGNFEASAKRPDKAQVTYFTGYSSIKRMFYPKTIGFIAIWMLVYLGIYGVSAYQNFKEKRYRGLVRYGFIIALITMVPGILLISIVGDGDADLAKHLFLIAVIFDGLTLMTITDILTNHLWSDESNLLQDEKGR